MRDRCVISGMLFFLIVVAVICLPSGTSQAQKLVDYLIIHHPSISPNGDGIKDSSSVLIGLLEQCDTLSVTVEDPSTGDTLDTILFVPDAGPGRYETVWNGEDSLGAMLDEGTYLMHLMATNADTTEHHLRTLVVDITPPGIVLERIEPGIYTPGVAGTPQYVTIYFSISDFEENDELTLTIIDPDATSEAVPHDVTGDGSYGVEWSTDNSAVDGIYSVDLHAIDEAGNSSEAAGQLDVDTDGPDIGFLDAPPEFTQEIPRQITGFCYDRNGLDDDPTFTWNQSESFYADTTFWQDDTLFWGLDSTTVDSNIIDTLGIKEIKHSIKVSCSDIFDHAASAILSFTIDISPPAPPILTPEYDLVYEPVVKVTGEVEDYQTISTVFIYRVFEGDTAIFDIDIIGSTFQEDVDQLGMGDNYIYGISLSKSGLYSERSTLYLVTYQRHKSGYPEVFTGTGENEFFRFELNEDAKQIDIHLYTVNGEHVRSLSEWGPKREFEIYWDLKNDDGMDVRNGPYVVYIVVYYENAKTTEKNFIAVVR